MNTCCNCYRLMLKRSIFDEVAFRIEIKVIGCLQVWTGLTKTSQDLLINVQVFLQSRTYPRRLETPCILCGCLKSHKIWPQMLISQRKCRLLTNFTLGGREEFARFVERRQGLHALSKYEFSHVIYEVLGLVGCMFGGGYREHSI